MVFVIIRIVKDLHVIKEWYGCSLADTKRLIDVYNDFSEGKIDNLPPVASDMQCNIVCMVGKNKTSLTQCDPLVKLGDVVSCLGVYIEFRIRDVPSGASETVNNSSTTSDAFAGLMSSVSKSSFLPPKHSNAVNDKLKLYNDIIDWLKEQGVGFISTNTDTLGKKLVNTLADVLWYIDGNHHTLEDRACNVPMAFEQFQNYRCPQKKKKKKLDASSLQEPTVRGHATSLLLLSENSFLHREQWTGVKSVIESLGKNLKKYADFLSAQKKRVEQQSSKTTVGEKQKWEVLSLKHSIFPGPLSRYQSLHTAILHSEDYVPILVNDHAPGEPNRLFDYMKSLVVPTKCVKYTYTGAKEHLVFIWKVPVTASENEILNKNSEISSDLRKTLPKFHTRAMRKEFMSLFGRAINNKAAFLREAYRRLTGDCSASLTSDESEIDKRVSEILDNEDSDLIWDLRMNNEGRPEKYTAFLEECQSYISEKVELAVDERRHDNMTDDGDIVTHLAEAFSIRDLHDQVVKRCPSGTRVPSKEWLRYQFWPRNRHFKTSLKYTGKLKIKFMIQSRQFRKHEDMHYASALFRYQKEFAIKFKDSSTFVSMDDKHKVKVGEPGYPVAVVERGKSVIVAMGKRFEVGDHDFTKFSITPSVCLVINIPDAIENSFYNGKVFVGVKENCFEASSPWRHATELKHILDKENANKPILLMYCDGGPDHRLTYASVQMSIISLFLQNDLDMIAAVRTPPSNSWKNPAERIMSVLNIGFQSVGVMRRPLATFESRVKTLAGISAVRNLAEKEPGLVDEMKDSIAPVKSLLCSVIERLKWKDSNLNTFPAASDDDISSLKSNIYKVDQGLVDGSTTQAQLKNKKQFHEFLSRHCQIRHYSFCVKKCGKSSCALCKAPKLPPESFEQLSFLPDPQPDDQESYKSFSNLYGTPTSEKFRPSLQSKESTGHEMPFSPTAQTAKNVEMTIYCSECDKPRVLYCKNVVRGQKRSDLQDILADLSYSCGATFNDVDIEDNHILQSVFVRKNLSCQMPIELTYFSAGFEPMCFYCGDQNETLILSEDSYPMCHACKEAGKQSVHKRGRCSKK